jgi:hypothetical protein
MCEVCVDGQPVAWPPMTVNVTAHVSGYDAKGTKYVEGSPVTRSLNLANSPDFSFPCP